MGTRKNPWISIGYSNYEGLLSVPFEWRKRAENHELNRQFVVSSILLELYVMATIGLASRERAVSVKRMGASNLLGNQKAMTEPARCCPRMVMLGDKTPVELLQTAFPERATELNGLFARTDLLPAQYNRADTRAEGNSLSEGFRVACQFVVSDAHLHGKLLHLNAATAVRRAYSVYKDHALNAYRVSCERLQDKLRFNAAKEDAKNWNEQLRITRIYQSTMNSSSGASVVLGIEQVTGLFKIYKDYSKPFS